MCTWQNVHDNDLYPRLGGMRRTIEWIDLTGSRHRSLIVRLKHILFEYILKIANHCYVVKAGWKYLLNFTGLLIPTLTFLLIIESRTSALNSTNEQSWTNICSQENSCVWCSWVLWHHAHDYSWANMSFQKCPQYYGDGGNLMNVHSYSWVLRITPEHSWTLMSTHEGSWALISSPE